MKRTATAAFYRVLRRMSDVDIPADVGDFRLGRQTGARRGPRNAGAQPLRPRPLRLDRLPPGRRPLPARCSLRRPDQVPVLEARQARHGRRGRVLGRAPARCARARLHRLDHLVRDRDRRDRTSDRGHRGRPGLGVGRRRRLRSSEASSSSSSARSDSTSLGSTRRCGVGRSTLFEMPRDSTSSDDAEFDRFDGTYEKALEDAVAFSGQDPAFFTEVKAELLIDLARRRLGEPGRVRALDLGCGPGLTDSYLTGSFGEVHGVDVSAAMVGEAAALNPAARYRCSTASRTPVRGRRVRPGLRDQRPPPRGPTGPRRARARARADGPAGRARRDPRAQSRSTR